MPLLPLAWSTLANTSASPACGAFVMKFFDAVDDPAVALSAGRRREAAGIGPDARLGKREAAEPLPARQLREVALPLLLRAHREDGPADERRVRRVGGPGRPAGGGHFLDRERIGHVVEPRAAVRLGHEDAQRAQVAQAGHDLAREPCGAVVLRGHRLDASLGERPDGVAKLPLRLGELDVHADRRS